MSLLRTITFLMLLGSSVAAQSPEIAPRERKDLLQDWKTVRFGFNVDVGDFAKRGATILLQRLDSKQVVLSVIPESSAAEWRTPVAVALVSEAHAVHLIERALDFYSIVRLETPPPKSDRGALVSLFVDIATDSYPATPGHSYSADFDTRIGTLGQFAQFVDDAAKRPKE